MEKVRTRNPEGRRERSKMKERDVQKRGGGERKLMFPEILGLLFKQLR